ncbi:hypothetical protein CLV92_10887 [Kineococcus xinjiangensis]|uniref:Uncharacterized protein n=1 Tax=Kineococcus xinjiangensis TaxID=512762 RepID=A0A2S6IJ13_9ACTN|nr:hypothetical protein [Kineococcus xinjiangensis]PPK94188.1 hypothetical protein CLV92_10887 [Kineococcus xinjiangensis]
MPLRTGEEPAPARTARPVPPYDFYAGAVTPAAVVPVPGQERRAPGGPARRPLAVALALAVAVVVAVVACGAWWAVGQRPAPAAAKRPVVLPEVVAGFAPPAPEEDFGRQEDWIRMQADLRRGEAFAGRAYWAPGPHRLPRLNVAAGRTGAADFADRILAAGAELRFGEVTCTRRIHFPAVGDHPAATHVSDTMVLCWRSTDDLTVTVLGLGSQDGVDALAAQAVEEVWAAVR